MPKFSIVTIGWNNLGGLRKTGASVLSQSCRDFEWIIIDGASSDGSIEAHASGEFGEAVFFSEPDRGLYDAMNKGIERASGDYLIFMNGGDAFADPLVLEDIASLDVFGSAALIYGDANEVEGAKTVRKPAHSHRAIAYTMFTHHQAMFYLRKEVGLLRYDLSYRIGADWIFTARLLRGGCYAYRVERVICDFERGGISQAITPALAREVNKERRRAMREVFNIGEPKASILIWTKAFVNTIRRWAPGLYDRLRAQSGC